MQIYKGKCCYICNINIIVSLHLRYLYKLHSTELSSGDFFVCGIDSRKCVLDFAADPSFFGG